MGRCGIAWFGRVRRACRIRKQPGVAVLARVAGKGSR